MIMMMMMMVVVVVMVLVEVMVMMIIIRIRRTNDYMAPWMTQLIAPRLSENLLQKIEETAPHTPVTHLHIKKHFFKSSKLFVGSGLQENGLYLTESKVLILRIYKYTSGAWNPHQLEGGLLLPRQEFPCPVLTKRIVKKNVVAQEFFFDSV